MKIIEPFEVSTNNEAGQAMRHRRSEQLSQIVEFKTMWALGEILKFTLSRTSSTMIWSFFFGATVVFGRLNTIFGELSGVIFTL
ncbi:hypothetical protein [Acidithrix sp. C25]|uniref:hypothetical protein n=1 Tax=Acidithrix sp. C25 TaxID=1671482 RepID=UPI001BC5973B|nr:hypothetical protein [Acidithrix sp. C25]CAG4902830.1 unnamed protein product [Acidithrix sp. C25]